jgi:hypothetical protein
MRPSVTTQQATKAEADADLRRDASGERAMFAVVQKQPMEAWSEDEHHGLVDVLFVGPESFAEAFLDRYRERHRQACEEWDEWDQDTGEWAEAHDRKFDELCAKFDVTTTVSDVEFEIVEVGKTWCA